jgi:hypothetical protein
VRSWDALPTDRLAPGGAATAAFTARGVDGFQAAGRYVHALPYGRTTDRADVTAVLREGRGTCSTKHALLAALAEEQGIPVALMLGIYQMDERNTPGVGVVLARHGLCSIPEAHCYLLYGGRRVDLTRSGAEPAESIARFLHEEPIRPAQIGPYKTEVHRQFIRQWLRHDPGRAGGRSLDEVWQIREACIAALAR